MTSAGAALKAGVLIGNQLLYFHTLKKNKGNGGERM